MYATAWHNGGPPEDPAGYGLRLTKADRDRYFDSSWEEVVLEMDGAPAASIPLSPSFWRSCSELRSATIGNWLLSTDAAPWAQGRPPGIAVTPIEGNQFSARLLQRRALQQ
ncbi:MAG TPA: hypothetical protein VNC61_07285 [Acidimicrobiales bacterium]|nr:hypothetical protein [Acidimicrobiales bacterium]